MVLIRCDVRRQTLSESVWRRVQSDTWSSRSVRFRTCEMRSVRFRTCEMRSVRFRVLDRIGTVSTGVEENSIDCAAATYSTRPCRVQWRLWVLHRTSTLSGHTMTNARGQTRVVYRALTPGIRPCQRRRRRRCQRLRLWRCRSRAAAATQLRCSLGRGAVYPFEL